MSPSDFFPAMVYQVTATSADGQPLFSVSHPLAYTIIAEDVEIDGRALERIEIDIPVDAAPELAYAHSDLEFNEAIGPAARVQLARQRADARALKKIHHLARFKRRHRQ